MSYQSIARKYRPQSFVEVMGQEASSKALANAIALGREPHVVLFAGVRGIGKTTTARLYAKSLNCLKGSSINPCDECESCKAIPSGTHPDVLEIDGASNTGINDVRSLQETIDYVPQISKYKVYIIDEVHMLSQAAFNALLKTLEEPPAHVVFIFATTELHKVPQTIISRCQTFFLKKIPIVLIKRRIVEILHAEQIEFDDTAVAMIAREGRGSMRDALTLLDQVIAIGNGKVNSEAVSHVSQGISVEQLLKLLIYLVEKNTELVIKTVDEFDQQGVDFAEVIDELAALTRHALIVRELGVNHLSIETLNLDEKSCEQLAQVADLASDLDLNRLFRVLVHARQDMTGSTLDRYILENISLEWCCDPGLPDLSQMKAFLNENGAGLVNSPQTPVGQQFESTNHKTPSRKINLSELRQTLNTSARASLLSEDQKKNSEVVTDSAKNEPQTPEAKKVIVSSSVASEMAMPAKAEFPSDWRALVNRLKEVKPLQARQFEEVYPLVFSPQKIVLAVDEASFASRVLLQRDEQKQFLALLQKIFVFDGILDIVPLDPASKDNQPLNASPEKLGEKHENLLDVKKREAEQRRESLLWEAQHAPLTKEMLAHFGATIENVQISDPL